MINHIAILAPGLLGSSVARAVHKKFPGTKIVIWARNPVIRDELKQQEWGKFVTDTPTSAVAGADLIVITAIVDRIVGLTKEIAPYLKPGAVVTDVGSVKTKISAAGYTAVRKGSNGKAHFVGSHPMAGSQRNGWRHGTPSLFEDRTCFVTPIKGSDRAAVQTVIDFWKDLGAMVAETTPKRHDKIVANISHLPQLVASSLSAFLADQEPIDQEPKWRSYAGKGLRDTTRIAGSIPELWKPIFVANQAEVLLALRGFQKELALTEKAVAAKDWDKVVALMSRGKAYRDPLGYSPR